MTNILRDIAAFRDARGWARHHTPRHLAEAISVEAGELLECFLWSGEFKTSNGADVEMELADVLIYALSMCLALGVEPEAIIREKMARNACKYPA